MTISGPATDQHQATCDALERSTPLLTDALRRAPGSTRPTKMRWTNAEIGAHLLASVIEANKSSRGEASVYDASGPTAQTDEQMVASVAERDPAALADEIGRRTAEFLATVRRLSGSQSVRTPRATIGTLAGLLALDHHLHGGQFAETAGTTWTGNVADMHAPLMYVLPYAFDPFAARGYSGSFTLKLRGVAPVPYAIDNGVLTMEHAGRIDCTIVADPQTFLRFGIGVVSQLRATLTGKILAGGRKPWRAFAVNRLFPPIAHGGVAK